MSKATVQLVDLESRVLGEAVPMSVVLPPDFQNITESLPLFIFLHGGGGDRNFIVDWLPFWEDMWRAQELPPLVLISFSSGGGSWYGGAWEKFVADELPKWANDQFKTRLDQDGTVMSGGSMGGYGALKIGFKYPERFKAIAPMEASIEPSFERTPGNRRNTWFRMEAFETEVWGSPIDAAAWESDNPAAIVRRNADAIRTSGLEIYLEVGDKDYINLHDGNEFLHRVLWDHDIRHEYHLVRWADHVGLSTERRMREACRFLAAALAGGLDEPTDLPLTDEEKAHLDWINGGGMAAGDPPPTQSNLMADVSRAPSISRRIWDPLRNQALDDPDMQRAYGKLPPTS